MITEVEMKFIPGYEPYYSATRDGRIFSHKTDKYLKQFITRKYKAVHLYDSTGKVKSLYVHRLVSLTYNGAGSPGDDVNHIDGDMFNNIADNLEWCDRSSNIKHAWKLKPSQPNRKWRKLTPSDVIRIKEMIALNHEYSRIAALFNCHRRTIYDIAIGKSWSGQ